MSRGNNFDLIRLVAALMVVVGHAYPLTGFSSPGLFGNSLQALGVKIFFVISGFLIVGSWRRDPSIYRYCMRRALRIFPGLAGVVIFCVFLLGLALTDLSWTDYLNNGRARTYFSNLVFYPQYDLPGVFTSNIYPRAVNGSLWSLPAEICMYVIGPMLCVAGARSLRAPQRGLFIGGIFIALTSMLALRIFEAPTAVIYGSSLSSFLDVSPYFLLGAIYNFPELKRRLNLTGVVVGAVLLAALAQVAAHPALVEAVLYVMLPSIVIFLGQLSFSVGNWLAEKGDISYGIYLYGFPVQQLVSHWLRPDGLSPWANTLFALPLTVSLAVASWVLIEKPFLRLKPKSVLKII